MQTQLKNWGLSENDAKRAGLREIDSINSRLGIGPDARAIEIPYYDIDGKPLSFSRYRILKSNKGAFDKLDMKYYQKKGTGVEIYLPNIVNWSHIVNDTTTQIIITEGEMKAYTVCRHNYTCIGLGGVSSFASKKQRMTLHPTLEQFSWRGRLVYIIYDSDLATNMNVRMAQLSLAKILHSLGARVFVGFVDVEDPSYLEDTPNKLGLDDAINIYGSRIVEDILNRALPFTGYSKIESLNKEAMYVKEQGKIYLYNRPLGEQIYMPKTDFFDAYAHDKVRLPTKFDKDGNPVYSEVMLGKAWIESPLATKVDRVVFEPSTTDEFIVYDNYKNYNEYRGLPYMNAEKIKNVSKHKAVVLFNKLLKFLCADLTDTEFDWLLRWMSEGIREPWIKPLSAVIMWSNKEGNGKSTVGEVLSRLYGDYSKTISSDDIWSPYNEYLDRTLFIQSDEMMGSDANNIKKTAENMNRIKVMITQPKTIINGKFLRPKHINDYARYFFTSNSIDTLSVNNSSRRFFIVHANEDKLPDDFYEEFNSIVLSKTDDSGLAAIHQWLLEYIGDSPTRVINRNAIHTAAKDEMIINSRTDTEAWLLDMQSAAADATPSESGGLITGQIVPEVITLRDMTDAYNNSFNKNTPVHNFIRSIRKYNVKILARKVKTKRHGPPDTIIMLANYKKWAQATDNKVVEYISNWRDYRYDNAE